MVLRIWFVAAHCFTDEDTGNFRQGYEDKTLEFFIAAGKSHRDYNDPRDANVAEKRSVRYYSASINSFSLLITFSYVLRSYV